MKFVEISHKKPLYHLSTLNKIQFPVNKKQNITIKTQRNHTAFHTLRARIKSELRNTFTQINKKLDDFPTQRTLEISDETLPRHEMNLIKISTRTKLSSEPESKLNHVGAKTRKLRLPRTQTFNPNNPRDRP